ALRRLLSAHWRSPAGNVFTLINARSFVKGAHTLLPTMRPPTQRTGYLLRLPARTWQAPAARDPPPNRLVPCLASVLHFPIRGCEPRRTGRVTERTQGRPDARRRPGPACRRGISSRKSDCSKKSRCNTARHFAP